MKILAVVGLVASIMCAGCNKGRNADDHKDKEACHSCSGGTCRTGTCSSSGCSTSSRIVYTSTTVTPSSNSDIIMYCPNNRCAMKTTVNHDENHSEPQ